MIPENQRIFLRTDRENIALESYINTIGRGETNRVRLTPQFVSKIHATILFLNGKWLLVDEGSKFGTFVLKFTPDEETEGEIQTEVKLEEGIPRELHDGDVIKLGHAVFRVVFYKTFIESPTTDSPKGSNGNAEATAP